MVFPYTTVRSLRLINVGRRLAFHHWSQEGWIGRRATSSWGKAASVQSWFLM